MKSPTKLRANCGAGFGAGLYWNLVRFGAIRCETGRAYKCNKNTDLYGSMLEGAALCKAVENGLKIRRASARGGSTPLGTTLVQNISFELNDL